MRFSVSSAGRSGRRLLLAAAAPVLLAVPTASGGFASRLESYLQDWYATMPGSTIAVSPTREVTVPGYSAWRLERRSEQGSPTRAESGLAIADAARDEVFLGEVLHDPDRFAAKRPFDPDRDLPNVQASLQELFGVPVRVEASRSGEPRSVPRPPVRSAAEGTAQEESRAAADRPGLRPLTVRARQGEDAWASLPGFVSADGATLLLGEFRPLAEPVVSWRRKLLAARPGVATGTGTFTVTEFLDFQCERCKRRTPEGRRAAEALGGTVEIRFFPLVKQHEWSFAAAECAAALTGSGPAGAALYAKYEEAVFARSEGMSAAAARELAADVAEAAGARPAFEAALSSGRARDRVLGDIQLASRLGIHGTPAWVLDGRLVPGERGFLENALFLTHGKGSKKESGDRVIR